ncbi:unnamed protein product [Penicillium egyptiacum]|uniref:RelA/SpoT domain-containing protein n=1 Tax=Penicillium egyptiacum TaxID=1303716 RepID=A0A9W4KIC2_9EURO|nr:unnamed protein product [Penicillium egyptiacum]
MAHKTTSTVPETESVVSVFVQQYVTEDIVHYQKALSAVMEICGQVLSDHGISHAIGSRLKKPASLENKLADRERKRGFPYQAMEEINNEIVDLAGVRILVHIPSNRTKVSELLRDAFVVKKMVNHPKQDEVNGAQQEHQGYVATHLHVSLKEEGLRDRGLQPSHAKPVEIQVISTELCGWANLEHDIIYKPKGKPPLAQVQHLETMRMIANLNENMHRQIEEQQTQRAAKENRYLRSVDDVGWVLHKWLEEHDRAWFHGREAGSCTSLFMFLKSHNINTRGELRQVLEASFGCDSEVVYLRLASEYPAGSLTLVVFIMDRLLLTNGGSGGVDFLTSDDHQVHIYKMHAMMSTFVWLDRLFAPAITWQQIFADQNQESLREGLFFLNSVRQGFFFDGSLLGQNDIAITDRLWDWFERQGDRQIRLTFSISKNGTFKDRKEARKVIQLLIAGLSHRN